VPADFPYEVILQALRGHPSFETEAALLLAVHDWDPTFRAAAFSSLGWWEPCHRVKVLLHLQEGRCDPNPTVRQYAQAALARLGERRALQYFRQGLNSADPGRAHDFIQMIATEGLALLWPDLDRLADSEDVDISFHAREALECLGEDMERERE
jgi:HEAT repeat protein